MASCMALKRPFGHDCDSSTNPFESRSASPSSKRQRRCFPMTVVSSSPPSSTTSDSTEPQVFPDVQPVLSTDALLIRIKEEVRRLQRRHQVKTSSPTGGVAGANAVSSEGSDDETETRANQPHLLTLKQVNLICARLLKEREEKIREEYDQILFEKLNEQHENFVRFTQDQLTRRFSELQFSYVS